MSMVDYLMGIGYIGIILLCVIITVFIFIAPILIAMYIANYLHFNGVMWWAVVIVLWLIIAGLISKLTS